MYRSHRLRQVDVKAEHFERQVARIEQERDTWEAKFEEAQGKYLASKKELDELATQVRFVSLRDTGFVRLREHGRADSPTASCGCSPMLSSSLCRDGQSFATLLFRSGTRLGAPSCLALAGPKSLGRQCNSPDTSQTAAVLRGRGHLLAHSH